MKEAKRSDPASANVSQPGVIILKTVRPLFIWICLVAWVTTEPRKYHSPAALGANDLFTELLVELLPPEWPSMALQNEEYWAIHHYLPLIRVTGTGEDVEAIVDTVVQRWENCSKKS